MNPSTEKLSSLLNMTNIYNDEVKKVNSEKELLKNNTSNLTEEERNDALKKKNESEDSFYKIFAKFAKDLIKFLGIRGAFIISKLLLSKGNKQNFLQALFSLESLRSVLCVSVLPLLYKLLIKFFGNKHFGVFLSGFISGFIAINIEEKSNLVQFLILSLFTRCLHATFLRCNKEIQFDLPYKGLEFSLFTIINTTLIALSFLIPHFTKLVELVDTHNNKTVTEHFEIDHFRRISKLI